jgi:hypothetical protein
MAPRVRRMLALKTINSLAVMALPFLQALSASSARRPISLGYFRPLIFHAAVSAKGSTPAYPFTVENFTRCNRYAPDYCRRTTYRIVSRWLWFGEQNREAYMKAGRKQLAIDHYKKSLEPNPANDSAKEKLKVVSGSPGSGSLMSKIAEKDLADHQCLNSS